MDAAQHGGTAPLLDRHVDVETPEHVSLRYELAGPGSRFAAFLQDAAIIVGLLLALFVTLFILALLGVARFGLPAGALPTLAAVLLIGGFAITWGYFVWFEAFREGQTPGKRRFSLRVVQEGGFPVTLQAAAIRNLIRIVDLQPFPSCLIGGALIALHPRAQRLGDMAAGTLVVREQVVPLLPEAGTDGGRPRLSDREYELINEYARRRARLDRPARDRLAAKLTPHFQAYAAEIPDARLLRPSKPAEADMLLTLVHADESARRAAMGARTLSGSPQAAALLRRQRPRWAAYDALLQQARRGRLTALPQEELSRFGALYREVASDLARAQTYGASPDMLYTLQRSVAAGHNLLYGPLPRSARRFRQWITQGYPALVRRRGGYILAAGFLFFGTYFATTYAVAVEPDRAVALVPPARIASAEGDVSRAARGERYNEVPELMMPLFSSQIITNNVQVAFIAFAGGIIFGLGTFAILVYNGIGLGAVFGLYHAHGLGLYIWSFAAPHGVLELTAITIAGGAGLLMGSALLMPGRRTRRQALTERSRDAVALLGGVVILLLLAGLIEGFISPSELPDVVKLAFGVVTGLLLFPWLLSGARGSAEATV
jgi:uncharacterized membrane protein SpoIIM required for sporulation/uncharacterized RDD family membrane protein YckC